MANLNLLKRIGDRSKTRVGRGGKRGKTSGRGGKGQTARAGNKRRPEWRDIVKKLPKRRGYGRNRGRTVVPRVRTAAVPLSSLATAFKAGAAVKPIDLVKAGLVRRVSGKVPPVKLVGGGDFSIKLDFQGVLASKGAKAAVEKAGGSLKKKAT